MAWPVRVLPRSSAADPFFGARVWDAFPLSQGLPQLRFSDLIREATSQAGYCELGNPIAVYALFYFGCLAIQHGPPGVAALMADTLEKYGLWWKIAAKMS